MKQGTPIVPLPVENVVPFPMSMRDKIFALEDEMRKLPQLEIPVQHHYSNGIYARTIAIPKGALVTGKIHRFRNLNILSKGELSVWIAEDVIERVRAPFITVSPPGTKRVAYAHEDSVWTTILRTDLTDPDEIEQHFIAADEREFSKFIQQRLENLCLS